MRKSKIQPYKCINWNFTRDELEYYDIMPYLVECWKEEKRRKHKSWVYEEDRDKYDDTRMPETFEEFKAFIKWHSRYRFWARCQYEVIVTGLPVQKHEHKLGVYEQILMNIDVVTRVFMDNVTH